MESLLLLSPEKRDEQAGECTLPDGEKVAFYELYPLYKEETEFKQANGLANLLDKLKTVHTLPALTVETPVKVTARFIPQKTTESYWTIATE